MVISSEISRSVPFGHLEFSEIVKSFCQKFFMSVEFFRCLSSRFVPKLPPFFNPCSHEDLSEEGEKKNFEEEGEGARGERK